MNNIKVIKGFTHLSRAWYGEANLKNADYIDAIYFGLYAKDGGTTGEMCVKWVVLNGEVTPMLTVFNDAWGALSQFKDLIDLLGKHNDENSTPQQFCEYLIECGFVDMTETTREAI